MSTQSPATKGASPSTHEEADRVLWSNLWLDDAPPEIDAKLSQMSRFRTLADGELLYARGDRADGLIGVRRGMIRLVCIAPDGHELLFGVFAAGTWFGEMSLFDDEPRPLHAYAWGETEVCILPATAFRKLLDNNPHWYRHFARVLCKKLRLCFDYIEDALLLPLSDRLTKRLLDLAQVYGKQTTDGVYINFPLPQDDLARMLGATRQSVNKELRTLAAKGLILLRRGKVTIVKGQPRPHTLPCQRPHSRQQATHAEGFDAR